MAEVEQSRQWDMCKLNHRRRLRGLGLPTLTGKAYSDFSHTTFLGVLHSGNTYTMGIGGPAGLQNAQQLLEPHQPVRHSISTSPRLARYAVWQSPRPLDRRALPSSNTAAGHHERHDAPCPLRIRLLGIVSGTTSREVELRSMGHIRRLSCAEHRAEARRARGAVRGAPSAAAHRLRRHQPQPLRARACRHHLHARFQNQGQVEAQLCGHGRSREVLGWHQLGAAGIMARPEFSPPSLLILPAGTRRGSVQPESR